MVGVIGVNYRIFKALAKNGISVFLVSQASSEIQRLSVCAMRMLIWLARC